MAKYSLTGSSEATAAEKVRANHRARIDSIRADRKLSAEGKQSAIARVYLDSKKEISRLEKQEAAGRNARINVIRKQVFGLSGTPAAQDVISYRDAQDRVSRLGRDDEEKARELYDRAELSGDTVLTAAIINRALEAGWATVANAFIEANPYKGGLVEELWDLKQADPSAESDIQNMFVNSLAFHIDKPRELDAARMDSQIEAIANTDS